METWDVWYPKAAAAGLLLARGRIDPTDRLIVHAVPDFVTVELSDDAGARRAFGQDLARTLVSPMCLLTVEGAAVRREDIWPGEEHIGLPVLLPGGEAGILLSWWNAEDRKEWRWQVEFYNSIR
jgi:hypothetical protein